MELTNEQRCAVELIQLGASVPDAARIVDTLKAELRPDDADVKAIARRVMADVNVSGAAFFDRIRAETKAKQAADAGPRLRERLHMPSA